MPDPAAARRIEIVTGLPDVCSGFPKLPEPLIERPHFLSNLDEMLDGSTLVIIEGEEGRGKTTLAAQFARKHHDRAFSLFVSAVSSFARSPDYLATVLCDQVHWHFKGVRMPAGETPERYLRSACLQLHRDAINSGKPFFFVVDGLLQMRDEDADIVSLVLTEYLPLGTPGFKFLLTGETGRLPEPIKGKVAVTSWKAPGFGPDETKKYLDGLGISDAAFKDISNTFAGVPGKLASIRRILLSGADPTSLENDLPRTLGDLLHVEWRAVNQEDQLQLDVLALIAFSQHSLSFRDIAQIIHQAPELVLECLKGLHFITVDAQVCDGDNKNGGPTFISDSMKKYAAKMLQSRKQASLERIVSALSLLPTSPEAIERMPQYLETLGKPKELINYLTLDHLGTVCESSNSLQPARRVLSSGIKAAITEKDVTSAFQFTFEVGLLTDVGAASVLTSEIGAYMTLGQDAKALALVQGALLKEDRLEGLAKIVGTAVRRGERADPALLAEVRRLVPDVNYSSTPERATSVASDIATVLPELALELVETAAKGNTDYSSDLALATLVLSLRDRERRQDVDSLSEEAISSRITNPSIRVVTDTLSAVVGGYSVDEILRRAEQIESTRACLYLLARWTARNPNHLDAHKVIEYGLHRALRGASDYTLDCRTLRRLSLPLPSLASEKPHEANKILQTIDAQSAVLLASGSSVEYVRLNTILLETEALWAQDRGLARAEQIYYFIANLEPDLKAESLAWFIATVTLDRHGRLSEVRSTLSTMLRADLELVTGELLSSTAEHYEILRGMVCALAAADYELAESVIQKVNTRDRRDLLRAEAISSLDGDQLRRVGPNTTQTELGRISHPVMRDGVVTGVVICLDRDEETTNLDPSWLPILKRSLSIERRPWKALACAHAAAICSRQQDSTFQGSTTLFKDAADVALASINSDWEKTDIAFTLSSVLFPFASERASTLVEEAHNMRRRSAVPDHRTAHFFIDAVRLTARAFLGLLPKQIEIEEALARLKRIIGHIPSDGERVRLWCELASRCFSTQHRDLGTTIVDDEVRPLLDNISDAGYRSFTIAHIAPALYSAHSASAVRQLGELNDFDRDQAYTNIAWFVLTGFMGQEEPLPEGFVRDELAMSDVDALIECLRCIQRDASIAAVVERLCSHLASPEGRDRFSRAERADIACRISEATNGRLPWREGIRHAGYAIVLEACLLQIRDASDSQWKTLIQSAEEIPNVADRAFVLTIIAEHAPTKINSIRSQALSDAYNLAKLIPSPFDQIGRLRTIARCAATFDKARAKVCLQEALSLCGAGVGVRDIESQQVGLIDLAYRIDADFAASLATELDQDPAIKKRKPIGRRSKIRDVLRGLTGGDVREELAKLTASETAELCEIMLQGLHNNSVASIQVQRLGSFIEKILNLPFREAHHTLAWVVENSIVVYSHTPYAKTHIVQLFGACASACELSIRLMSRAVGSQYIAQSAALSLDIDGTEEIEPGNQGKALDLLAKWIEEVQPQTITICDPYFSPSDLDILKLINQWAPAATIRILAGEKKQRDLELAAPFDEAYQDHWSSISQQKAPPTEIVVAGLANSHELPIHERWVLANGRGLRLGTSLSGLGGSRLTEISYLSDVVATSHQSTVEAYLGCRVRESNGTRVRYSAFSL